MTDHISSDAEADVHMVDISFNVLPWVREAPIIDVDMEPVEHLQEAMNVPPPDVPSGDQREPPGTKRVPPVPSGGLVEPSDEAKVQETLVDKGFHIDETCHKNGWNLIRPPFKKKGKKQFTATECVSSCKIASARVHVERSNQRIKTFTILGAKYPVALVSILPDIFNVVCATINLSSPILKDDKFMVSEGCFCGTAVNEE
ncbi:hypothetical protein QAD02_018429 [Eretmocerus hayati]|uniref:Uncharacterized protein n=1 Tax=Eretmocerus hayati TaxID=131215 RepID=A0ACC2PGP1_9HYME|nr:hypothetical protein QAD02_018429 [Eretmocerus hayati]